MPQPKLSIIYPYYKKIREFSRLLPINAPRLANPKCEVVLVLDEPSQEHQVLALIRQYSRIRWRVIVNDKPHSWRTPCKACNVGIQYSLGEYVMPADPESVFMTEVVNIALEAVQREDRIFVLGCIAFSTFRQARQYTSANLAHAFERGQSKSSVPLFYGSICTRKEHLIAITGYDESCVKWGADDDNLRLRLMMSGIQMAPEPNLKLLHLSFEARLNGHASRYVPRYTKEEKRRLQNPRSPIANRKEWGRDFDRIAFDWAKPTS